MTPRGGMQEFGYAPILAPLLASLLGACSPQFMKEPGSLAITLAPSPALVTNAPLLPPEDPPAPPPTAGVPLTAPAGAASGATRRAAPAAAPMARSIKRALSEGGPLVWPRLAAGFSLPSAHPEVQRHARRYAGNKRALQRMLGRAEPFLYDILVEIEARKLPAELALVPAVESHYNPFAYSPRHAAGLWQFIPGTARQWGLRNTKWYDGRLDTRAATEAALDYLEFLHRRFGDWLLALAAYNAGEGRVDNALEASKRTADGHSVFWKLRLPKETRMYVPKLLGLAALIAQPQQYRVDLPPLYDRAFFAQVPLKSSMRLEELSRLAALPLADLQQSNPALKRSITDPDGPHYLYLPQDAAQRLTEGLRNPASLKLALAPKGSSGTALPVKVAVASPVKIPAKPTIPEATRRFGYTVQHGDTLWDISRAHHVSIRRLAAWNGLQPDSPLRPGHRLILWLPEAPPQEPGLTAVVYTVGIGETLATIAQRFGLEIGRICAWNDLAREAMLAPGLKLKLLLPRERGRRAL